MRVEQLRHRHCMGLAGLVSMRKTALEAQNL